MTMEQSINNLAGAIDKLANALQKQCCQEAPAPQPATKRAPAPAPKPAAKPAPKKEANEEKKSPAPRKTEAPKEQSEAAPGFPYSKLQDAVVSAVNRAGRSAAVALLAEYKVKLASDIPEELWPEAAQKFDALEKPDAE